MSLAELVIVSVKVEGRSKSEVARDYKISRYWVQQLVRRYEAEGEAAFTPRSRRPHSNSRAISLDLEDQIIRLRKDLSKKGLDAGAETIRTHLQTAGADRVPSTSTIWRVADPPRIRHTTAEEATQGCRETVLRPSSPTNAGRPTPRTGSWPTAAGWRSSTSSTTTPGSTCCPRPGPTTTGPDVVAGFRTAFGRYGIPASVLTDNGAVFTGKPRGGGRVALEIELDLLGVRFHHSRPYHPQTCGKVERFHQTQKKWLAAQPPPATLADLQRQLDRFRRYYNTVRPHRALARRTPEAGLPAPAPRPPRPSPRSRCTTGSGATRPTPAAWSHCATTANYATSAWAVSTPANGSWSCVADRYVRAVDAETGELLRELTLDPTKRLPTTRPATRPTQTPTLQQALKCNDVPQHLSTVSRDIAGGLTVCWFRT